LKKDKEQGMSEQDLMAKAVEIIKNIIQLSENSA
jgi:hypothetical protein